MSGPRRRPHTAPTLARTIHLARLESPSDAHRCACGAWRERGNWTSAPERVTCPECLRQMALKRSAARADHATALP